jgi:hypothetical protein
MKLRREFNVLSAIILSRIGSKTSPRGSSTFVDALGGSLAPTVMNV